MEPGFWEIELGSKKKKLIQILSGLKIYVNYVKKIARLGTAIYNLIFPMSVVLILDIEIYQVVSPLNLTYAQIITAINVSIHPIANEDWNQLNKYLTVGKQ